MASPSLTVTPNSTSVTVTTTTAQLLANQTSASVQATPTSTTITVDTGSGGGGGGTGTAYPTLTVTSVSADTTLVAATHDVVLVDASGAARTIALPPAASNSGAQFTVKKVDSSANTVTLDPNSAELVDGATTYVLTDQWEAATVVCNGTAWYLL